MHNVMNEGDCQDELQDIDWCEGGGQYQNEQRDMENHDGSI